MPRRLPDGIVQFLIDHPDGVAPPGKELRCGRCLRLQPIAEFYVAGCIKRKAAGGRLTGNYVRCRSCAKKYADRLKAPRQAIIDEAKAGGCVDCGLVMPDHLYVFDFDHTKGDKVKNVSAWLTTGTEDDLRAEIDRCEVVCANCHRIRSASRPHGSRGRDGRKPSRTMVDPA